MFPGMPSSLAILTALSAFFAAEKPLPSHVNRWAIDFQRQAVPVVLVGKQHLYYTTNGYRTGFIPELTVADMRPVLVDSKEQYDFQMIITCADATTGKKLWSRRTAGYFHIAVDDRTDHLYVWRETLFRLQPKTGDVDQTKELPRRPNRVEALVIAGRPHIPQPDYNLPDDNPGRLFQTYNVDTGRVDKCDVLLPVRLSPEERRRLTITATNTPGARTIIGMRSLAGNITLWQYAYSEYTYSEPFWLDRDVMAFHGHYRGQAEVVRLNGEDGTVKWRFTLPQGAYTPGHHPIPGNVYPPRTWSAVGLCGKQLLAIGADGTLYFLDPMTGKLLGQCLPSKTYLSFPRMVDGSLIICGVDGIRAIPMKVLGMPER